MKKILLVTIGLSVLLMADLSRSSAGVVTDGATGLQWQDDYTDNGGDIKAAKWTDAIDYCEHLGLDGGGWRLPNINELKSIIDTSKVNPAIVDSFENVVSDNYWSSTTYKDGTGYAWVVYFGNGGVGYSGDKDDTYHVRCVRAGQL